jgi:eukaryotic-like serine/threonine-protein kinase
MNFSRCKKLNSLDSRFHQLQLISGLVLVALLTIVLLSCSSPKVILIGDAMAASNSNNLSSAIPNKLLDYKNSTYGISMQYPANWESTPGENNNSGDSSIDVVSFSPTGENNSSATVDLLVDTVDSSQNLKQFVSDSISDNKIDLKDFKVLDSSTGDVTLASAPAYKIVYTYTDAGQNFKGLETGTIIGNKVYFVQYENSPAQYDRDLPSAQKMIDSLKIENSANVIKR